MGIAVIIPTKNRPKLLKRALQSVNNQTLIPDIVIVINDSDENFIDPTKSVIDSFNKLNIYTELNFKSKNLSGAINSGLEKLSKLNFNPIYTFVALLDDDDWWDPKYLQECTKIALDRNFDWIISGLIRYDKNNPNGWKMPIPKEMTRSMIFTGNPNVQGSNLFLKLSFLIQINGFDESLISSTDRDICIRLLDECEIKIGFLNRYFVHHWAMDDYTRLSTPKTPQKEKGLRLFFEKYKSSMTEREQVLFKERVRNFFLIDL